MKFSRNPIITVYNYHRHHEFIEISSISSSDCNALVRRILKRREDECDERCLFFIRNKRTSRANNGFGSSKKPFVNGPSNFQIMKRCASRLHASTINFSAAEQGGKKGGGGGGGNFAQPNSLNFRSKVNNCASGFELRVIRR